MTLVLLWEKVSPLSAAHAIALLMESWAISARAWGSGPEIRRQPSSAQPMAKVGLPSKIERRESKARFQAIGLNTPPCGVPCVRNLVRELWPSVTWHDLFVM